MRTVWMNVTTSANWNRPAVGIIRVEQELNKELKKLYSQGGNFKDCIWNGIGFSEFSAVSKDDNREIKLNPPKSFNKTENFIFPLVNKKQAVINIAQAILSLTPRFLRLFLNDAMLRLKKPMANTFNWLHRFKSKFNKQHINQLSCVSTRRALVGKDPLAIFSEGDVLISIGLDWSWTFYQQFYELRKRNIKVVTCCYDLIPILYPQYCVSDVAAMFKNYFLDLAEGSDLMFCISRNTEHDLLDFLNSVGGRIPKTKVFELGDSVTSNAGKNISPDIGVLLEQRFILYVSSIERRKNHEILYRAYHLLCKEGRKNILPKLIFVGMHGWGIAELMSDINLDPLTKGMIIILNNVSDAELAALYKQSLFVVYPSLYEGWGLPVGEALAYGKAIISSDAGSLREVGLDLVEYVNPWDVRAWANSILEMCINQDVIKSIEEKVVKSYSARTWSQSGLNIFNEIENL